MGLKQSESWSPAPISSCPADTTTECGVPQTAARNGSVPPRHFGSAHAASWVVRCPAAAGGTPLMQSGVWQESAADPVAPAIANEVAAKTTPARTLSPAILHVLPCRDVLSQSYESSPARRSITFH